MAARLGMNRNTVLRALRLLRDEGPEFRRCVRASMTCRERAQIVRLRSLPNNVVTLTTSRCGCAGEYGSSCSAHLTPGHGEPPRPVRTWRHPGRPG
ncbi:MAG TPA: hypothetical protein VFO01_07345 [Trebonia sp.]|nr:hypothetical protein [Trebonia sp.]